MKIKNLLLVLLVASFFVSCAKDGSRTIRLDEFAAVVPQSEYDSIGDCKETCDLFSIVPGEYTISWTLCQEKHRANLYGGTMVIKLRLNKTVHVHNVERIHSPTFRLVDADGNELSVHWSIGYEAHIGLQKENKDKYMDFIKFLQSEPGTEMDVTLGTLLSQNSDARFRRQIDEIKRAKGLIMEVPSDVDFRWGAYILGI